MTQTKNQIETAAKVLGVPPSASLPAIKAAYRGQVKKYHPDMIPTSGGVGSARLLAVLDAFEILSNPRLRAEYDRALAEQRKAKAAAPKQPEPPPSRVEALARAGVAVVQLGFAGGVALLLVLVAVVAVIQIATGR
jgi:curved DNA-binding protein CbpA